MQRFGIRKVKHLLRGAKAVTVVCLTLAGLTRLSAYAAAPANDNFASAQVLTGDFGSVTNNTTAATAETGEPSHAGVRPFHTVWYKWTASTDGPVEFDTFNSGFDTVLAVYLPSLMSPTVQNLNQVVANDDINVYEPEFPNGYNSPDPYIHNPYLGPSGVKFNAHRGQLYYIAVGGNSKSRTDPGFGQMILSWAYHPSGVFRLSFSFYECTEAESDNPPDGSVGPSARGARITINRLFGSSGKVLVTFDLIDGTAIEGINYTKPQNTTIVFEDNETSKSIVIPVIDDGVINDLNPGRQGLASCPGFTDFQVVLTRAVLDPLEDNTVLSPPRIHTTPTYFPNYPGQTYADSPVFILDMDTSAACDPLSPTLGATNGVINFERSWFRVEKGVGTARIMVYRGFDGDPQKDCEIHYRVISNPWINPNFTIYNQFVLAAGSDYAHPLVHFPDNDPPGQVADFGTTNEVPGRTNMLALDHRRDFNLVNPTENGCSPGDVIPPFRTLKWAQGDWAPKSIVIPIIANGVPEFNKDIYLELFSLGHGNDGEVGWNYFCNVTIENSDPPPGALDATHNPDWDIATDPPNNPVPGTDNFVYSLAVHPSDNKTIIGGNFSTYNAYARYGLARLNPDGSVDHSFDPGDGVPVKDPVNPAFVTAVAYTPSDKIIIGGSFPSYNGTPRFNVAQVNPDGSLDASFNPGLGANATVWAVAVQTNGQVLIGGEFTSVNGFLRNHIARLNPDGSLDQSFDPGTNGPNGTVNAIAVVPDGSIYIGGDFSYVNNLFRSSIARISTNGVVVPSFSPVTGCDGPVFALALQPDGKLLVGGFFANVEFRSRNNIARYNADGSLDPGFDPGTGFDDGVYTLALQPNGRIFAGGLFTSYNQTRRIAVARLFSTGELDTGFMDTAYNQFAGPHKIYFNPYVDPKDFLYTVGLQSDGNLMIGGKFHYVGGGRFAANVITNSPPPVDNFAPPGAQGLTRAAYRSRWNVTRLVGGDCIGPGSTSLLYTNYDVVENMSFLYIKETRQNGTLGRIESTFSIPPRVGSNGVGVAQSGTDYTFTRINPEWNWSWHNTRCLGDGLLGTNNVSQDWRLTNSVRDGLADIYVTVANISGYQGDRSLPFKLDMPSYSDNFYLGGEVIPLGAALGRSSAMMRIQEDDVRPGVIGFASASYSVNENGTNAVITIIRTNGSTGVVPFRFATTNGTAVAGVNYAGVTNTVTFRDGQTSTNVFVPIFNDFTIQAADRTINLYLANPGNGATLGALSNAVLFIVDDDFLPGRINFPTTTYTTNEDAGAMTLVVNRNGGNLGVLDVQYATSNLTAVAGVNYQPVTGTFHWDDGDTTPRFITIPMLHDGLVTPSKQFTVTLFNPSVPGALGSRIISTNTIVNVDFYGTLQLSSASYNVNEQGGYATITVTRTGGSAETVSASFNTADGTAYQFFNYMPTNGSLVFGPGQVSKSFTIPILDDGVQDPTFFGFNVLLSNFSPASSAGNPSQAFVNIIDSSSFTQPPGQVDTYFNPDLFFNDDVYSVALQPDGKIVVAGNFTIVSGQPANRIVRLSPDGFVDTSFLSLLLSGANDAVRCVVNQVDTRLLLGGAFSSINGVVRNSIARVNYDGTLDSGFNPGSGADNIIYTVAETFDRSGARKVMAGGSFVNFNGVNRPGLVRLNDDGTVDNAFNTGLGVNGTVYSIAVYPTNTINAGKVVIGGDFTAVNGVVRTRLARFNTDGSLDASFDPGSGANDAVRAVVLEPDGRILVGGAFTNLNGVAVNRIARLNLDGSVDPSFQGGAGGNSIVYTLALQQDNRILVGGGFTRFSGITRNRITRLLPDGQVDPTINFGIGANDYVDAIAVRPDAKLIIGGGFTQVQGLSRQHLARLYGGSVVGSGSFRFTSPTYEVDENATNIVISVIRTGGTSGPNLDGTGNVSVNFVTSDGTAQAGVNYSSVNTPLVFPPGEILGTAIVPVFDDQQITPDLTVNLALANPTPPSTLGPQPTAVLTIFNIESAVSFASQTYYQAEDAVDGLATIGLVRVGSTRLGSSVLFSTTTNGNAVAGMNYTPVTNDLVVFQPGQTTASARVPIFHTPVAEGDTTVSMQITDPLNTLLVAPSQATLTIIDVDSAPGTFVFSRTNYFVGEGDGFAIVTVVRTNGRAGDSSITAMTLPGDATPGLKYIPTNYTIPFANGETIKSFAVQILEENQVEGNQSLYLLLTNATGGTSLGTPNPVPLTIVDDDIGVSFATNSALNAVYIVSETNSLITIDVYRLNAQSNVVTTVSYYTTNGTATAGVDYLPTSGTLTFNAGESHKIISVNILRDTRVTGDLTFAVKLANPTPGVQIAPPSTANVIINDIDTGLSIATTNSVPVTNALFSVFNTQTNVTITVLRTNANTGPVSVYYQTLDGTAQSGIDYFGASGTLTFTNGQLSNSFNIQINPKNVVDIDRSFDVSLFGPTPPGQLLQPSTATVNILNRNAGFNFTSASYDVLKNGVAAVITVQRTGYTNSTVSVNFATQNGTASPVTDYTPTNGVLVFTNGEISKSFAVGVIDNDLLQGDRTVLLSLSAPSGLASLIDPSAATLTIHDVNGSLVIPAGTSLTSESFAPPNGVIEPGETVGLLFAFRNSGGTNTVNLVATLLATNGISAPSAPQSYGVLTALGPSASRPFSFTASGTNGQRIVATFQLTDLGHPVSTNSGIVVFNFTLGTSTASVSTNSTIIINDLAVANPYPSTIDASGIGGVISKVTLSMSNYWHGTPTDVDTLLVSPNGLGMLPMGHAGIGPATRVNLTFDDAAANVISSSQQITSGTYKPSVNYPIPAFPPPAPATPGSGSFPSSFSVFNGVNPNGRWSLYVMDDSFLDNGAISNGWRLNFTLVNPVISAADVGITMSGSSSSVVLGSNVAYTIGAANYGPGAATAVTVTNRLPAGASFVSASPSIGTAVTNSSGLLIWNLGGMAKDATASLTLTVLPNAVGLITNSATVGISGSDLNPDDNTAAVITTVIASSADLAVGVFSAPEPVIFGQDLTYSIVVSNLGPGSATAVSLTDTLPPGVSLISAAPPGYIVNGGTITFTNLGTVGLGQLLSASVVVQPLVSGLITNSVSCASPTPDPYKLNNHAAIKDLVETVTLSYQRIGNNLTLAWPAGPPAFVLQSATNLTPPVVWTTVTNGISTINGQNVAIIPIGSGDLFFRLSGQTP